MILFEINIIFTYICNISQAGIINTPRPNVEETLNKKPGSLSATLNEKTVDTEVLVEDQTTEQTPSLINSDSVNQSAKCGNECTRKKWYIYLSYAICVAAFCCFVVSIVFFIYGDKWFP
ncbi:hypothetical protein CDIK_2957 [Cucumispora dikerogammari]|nr:hypothetical protein CDIK_2957 [Cucumispora dikerogammari]